MTVKEYQVNAAALIRLKNNRHLLTERQYRTLRGQVLAGDTDGAMKGMHKLIARRTGRPVPADK